MDETLLLEDERNDLAEARELDEDHGHCTEVIEQFAIRLVTLRGELQTYQYWCSFRMTKETEEWKQRAEKAEAELAAAQRHVEKCAGLGIDEILKMQRELTAAKKLIVQVRNFLELIEPGMLVTEHHWREATYQLTKIDELTHSLATLRGELADSRKNHIDANERNMKAEAELAAAKERERLTNIDLWKLLRMLGTLESRCQGEYKHSGSRFKTFYLQRACDCREVIDVLIDKLELSPLPAPQPPSAKPTSEKVLVTEVGLREAGIQLSAKPALLSAEDLEQELTAVEVLHATPAQRLRQHIDAMKMERDAWTKMGIVELAVRNQSVSDYITHWEGRTLTAERTITHLRNDVIKPLVAALDGLMNATYVVGNDKQTVDARNTGRTALATARAEIAIKKEK